MDSHGGDVLQQVLLADAQVPRAAGAVEGRHGELLAAVRPVAEDLRGGAGAGGMTVQEGAPAALEENQEEKQNFPERKPRPQSIHPAEQRFWSVSRSDVKTRKEKKINNPRKVSSEHHCCALIISESAAQMSSDARSSACARERSVCARLIEGL